MRLIIVLEIILKVGSEECQLWVKIIPYIWRVINLMNFFYKSGFGEVMTLFDDNPTILEECQLCMHVDHEENIFCDGYIVNLILILHVIIMRAENMVVEIFILLNCLSSC